MTTTILHRLVDELQRTLDLMLHPPASAAATGAIAPRVGAPTGGVGPFQRRLLEVPTTFGNEQDGTWLRHVRVRARRLRRHDPDRADDRPPGWYGPSTQDSNSFPSTYQGGASWGVTYFTR